MDDERGADFFISYTTADRDWAEWIAWQLEHAGYAVLLQAWDFVPGKDFIHEMEKATSGSRRTIALLSENYRNSSFGEAEWRSVFAKDPTGEKCLLIPVKVAPCSPPALLQSRVYIDLTGKAADEARDALLIGLSGKGARPVREPAFPGQPQMPPMFPGDIGQRHEALQTSRGARIEFPSGRTALYFPQDLGLGPGVAVESDRYPTLRELLDDLYVSYLSKTFPPFSYGERWILRGRRRCVVPIGWLSAIGAPLRSIAENWQGIKPSDAGIRVDNALWIYTPGNDHYYGVITDNANVLAVLDEHLKVQYLLAHLHERGRIASLDEVPSGARHEGVFIDSDDIFSGQIFDLRGPAGAELTRVFRR